MEDSETHLRTDMSPCHHMKLNHHLVLGHPHSSPGHNCGIMNSAVQYSWQSSSCTKRLGYICYSKKEVPVLPTEGKEK